MNLVFVSKVSSVPFPAVTELSEQKHDAAAEPILFLRKGVQRYVTYKIAYSIQYKQNTGAVLRPMLINLHRKIIYYNKS